MNYLFDFKDFFLKPYEARKKVVLTFQPSFYVGSGMKNVQIRDPE
jgi:hypothetical protein